MILQPRLVRRDQPLSDLAVHSFVPGASVDLLSPLLIPETISGMILIEEELSPSTSEAFAGDLLEEALFPIAAKRAAKEEEEDDDDEDEDEDDAEVGEDEDDAEEEDEDEDDEDEEDEEEEEDEFDDPDSGFDDDDDDDEDEDFDDDE